MAVIYSAQSSADQKERIGQSARRPGWRKYKGVQCCQFKSPAASGKKKEVFIARRDLFVASEDREDYSNKKDRFVTKNSLRTDAG